LDTSELEAAYRSVLDLAAGSPDPGAPAAGLIGELGASSRELLDLAGLLAIQARRHLPMHEAQLGELLGGRDCRDGPPGIQAGHRRCLPR
jgi:hypothetical protein